MDTSRTDTTKRVAEPVDRGRRARFVAIMCAGTIISSFGLALFGDSSEAILKYIGAAMSIAQFLALGYVTASSVDYSLGGMGWKFKTKDGSSEIEGETK